MADLIPTIMSDGEDDTDFIPAPEIPEEDEENLRMAIGNVDELYSDATTDDESEVDSDNGADWDYRKGAAFKADPNADFQTTLLEKIEERRKMRAAIEGRWKIRKLDNRDASADAAIAKEEKSDDTDSKSKNKKNAGAITSETQFADLNVSRPFLKALQDMKFTAATPVQRDCIPPAIEGRDILATAETGSGKTVAFLLPLCERIGNSAHVISRSASNGRGAQLVATKAMVLLPTRELATQCFSMLQALIKYTALTSALVAGGFSSSQQLQALKHQPDILVATPGRILDHLMNAQVFHLEMLEIVVFDEADRLLDMGFRDECKEILRRCAFNKQCLLFSATFNTEVADLASIALKNPLKVKIAVNTTVKTLRQEFVLVDDAEKDAQTGALIHGNKAKEATLLALCRHTFTKRCIIFFATKKQAHRCAILFGLEGLTFAELHGNLTQEARTAGIESFQSGKAEFLFATDLAARGLDINGVETVINFEVPEQDDKYIHRVGRTARMGSSGVAVTLHFPNEYRRVKKLAKQTANKEADVESNARGNAKKKAGKKGGKKGAKEEEEDDANKIKSTLLKRQVATEHVIAARETIKDFETDVRGVVDAEGAEFELRQADVEISRAQNMDKHREEIFAKPKKVWLMTNAQKEEAAKEAAEEYRADKKSARDGVKREWKENVKMSRKQKIIKQRDVDTHNKDLYVQSKAKASKRKNAVIGEARNADVRKASAKKKKGKKKAKSLGGKSMLKGLQ